MPMQLKDPASGSFLAHLSFGLLLLVLGLASSALMAVLSIKGMLPNALAAALLAVPLAVVLSRRIGSLSLWGTAVAALLTAVVSQAMAFALLIRLAGPETAGSRRWEIIDAHFVTQFTAATAVVVAASVAWTMFFQRRSRNLV